MPLKWSSGGRQYYSLLTNPCGFILIELMSDTITLIDPDNMKLGRQRMTFEHWNNQLEPGDYLTPIRVSRVISKPGLVDTFWKEILGSEEIYQVGSFYFILQLNSIMIFISSSTPSLNLALS